MVATATVTGTMSSTKTVLVADDTAFVRDRFKTALEAAGHAVRQMAAGCQFVEVG